MPLCFGKNSWCPLITDPLVPAFNDVGVKQCSDSVILRSKTRTLLNKERGPRPSRKGCGRSKRECVLNEGWKYSEGVIGNVLAVAEDTHGEEEQASCL